MHQGVAHLRRRGQLCLVLDLVSDDDRHSAPVDLFRYPWAADRSVHSATRISQRLPHIGPAQLVPCKHGMHCLTFNERTSPSGTAMAV